MLFAIVDDERKRPEHTGQRGECPGCGGEVLGKCGEINIHHWAHLSGEDCDPWSEPEGEWHLAWKNMFPKEWQEQYIKSTFGSEKHRADIKIPGGPVIELQSSSISNEEIKKREKFYNKFSNGIIWIVNGEEFTSRWETNAWDSWPNIKKKGRYYSRDHVFSRIYSDASYEATKEIQREKAFELIFEYPDINRFKVCCDRPTYFTLEKDESLDDNNSCDLTPVQWPHTRKCWAYAQAPVFFDTGIERCDDEVPPVVKQEIKTEKVLKRNRPNADIRIPYHWDVAGEYEWVEIDYFQPEVSGLFEWIGTVNNGKHSKDTMINGRDKLNLPKYIVGKFHEEWSIVDKLMEMSGEIA
jgi:hypothetical protein|tara:strand:+ start:378 stop:1439 length:1062 start_codon:yes stop_codon:yes gene_type:complete